MARFTGVHRWLAPRQDSSRQHVRQDRPRVLNGDHDWQPREAPPLNGETHRHLSHAQHSLPQPGSHRQHGANPWHTRYGSWQHKPAGDRPQWPRRSPEDGSERTPGAGVSSAGVDGRWRQPQQQGNVQQQSQHEEQLQQHPRQDHHAGMQSSVGVAGRGVPPHTGKSDVPPQQRPARPPPRSRPRARWLGALKPTEGSTPAAATASENKVMEEPAPAAATASENKVMDEPASSPDDEVAATANESALHRWIVPGDATASARQQREPRSSYYAPRPLPPPKPKKDWSAYAPPKNNLVSTLLKLTLLNATFCWNFRV